MKKNYHKILKTTTGTTYNLPVYLNSTAYEMGGMVGFDGDIEQVEQLVNFHYQHTSPTAIRFYNTVNNDKLKIIRNQTFTIDWGDGSTQTIGVGTGNNLSYVQHSFSPGVYNVSIELDNSWVQRKITKKIIIPQVSVGTVDFGTLTYNGTYQNITEFSQDYINDLDVTDNDGDAILYFAVGDKGRVSELKRYGENTYQGISTGTDVGGSYTGYTIDNLSYKDYEDGTTMITGSTSNFYKEEVFNEMLTRNEHFIGFIDEPTIYSDVFVERGKQGVLEMNLRLGEIDNVGELDIYGNGFFQVKKQ